MSPEIEQRIRVLWEETPQTARAIAAEYGMSRCALMGVAHRRGWVSFNAGKGGWYSKARTMDDRLAAHHAKLDRVLAETAPTSGHYLGCPAVRL